jgi:hypothetical protein
MSASRRGHHRIVTEYAKNDRDNRPYWNASELHDMNDKFCGRLLKAMLKGHETVVIGVDKAPCTANPVFYLPNLGRVRRGW